MKELLKNSGKAVLLGNEAIVRGALEAGVQFVATYPGTPASEIGNTFYQIHKQAGVYFEFSTNEKTALEAGVGASFSGLKTLVAMKNFGLNVASDALMPFLYTGSKGPTVIVVADDPSCHSSAQSEQNSRPFAELAHIPILEPSSPEECNEFVKFAFRLSAQFKLPIMIRITTRVAHQRSAVVLNRRPKYSPARGHFVKNKNKFVTMPPRVLEMKKELFVKLDKIEKLAEKSVFNIVDGKSPAASFKPKIGIICSGVSYLYTKEAIKELEIKMPVLKLAFFNPLPREKIKKFITGLNRVLIVEELEPYLEKGVSVLAKEANPSLEIMGKNVLPQVGEMTPDLVIEAVAKAAGKKYRAPKIGTVKKVKHLPRFCTGWPTCPYWKLFAAVKQAAPKNTIFGGDIGCYMIAALPPHNLYDYLSCMGSSIGIGHGIKKASPNQKLISFIGDGTFFHAGFPAILNSVYNKSNQLVIILDNRITAMTGHQPNPGSEIKIEDILKAIKIKNIAVIDQEEQYNQLVKTIKRFLDKKELSVIIARRVCGLLAKKQLKSKKK